MSQIASHPSASSTPDLSPGFGLPPRRPVVLRSLGYAGGGYLLVLGLSTWIARVLAGSETYLNLAIPALAATIVAPTTALLAALIGWWPYRQLRLEGEDRIRYNSATTVVLIGTGAAFVLDRVAAGVSVLLVGFAALSIMKLALLSRRHSHRRET